jgi:hypothetical protein
MPNCFQNLDACGEYGDDIRSMAVPDPVVDICPGDFLTSTTDDNCRTAKLMSAFTWTTDLATTQAAAKLVFDGVSLGELDADACANQIDCVPYAKYRQGNSFRRLYKIVDATGADDPQEFVEGQGFTFGKNPTSDALTNHTIQPTSNANLIVFRAVKSTCGEEATHAMVEFAS